MKNFGLSKEIFQRLREISEEVEDEYNLPPKPITIETTKALLSELSYRGMWMDDFVIKSSGNGTIDIDCFFNLERDGIFIEVGTTEFSFFTSVGGGYDEYVCQINIEYLKEFADNIVREYRKSLNKVQEQDKQWFGEQVMNLIHEGIKEDILNDINKEIDKNNLSL